MPLNRNNALSVISKLQASTGCSKATHELFITYNVCDVYICNANIIIIIVLVFFHYNRRRTYSFVAHHVEFVFLCHHNCGH